MTHHSFAASQVDQIGFKTNQAASRNDRFDRHARRVMIHAHDLAFAIGDRLQNVTEIFVRKIDIKIFERLEQLAIFCPVKNHLGTRDHDFVAFAPHLLDQDCDLHLAAGIDLKCAGGFGIVDLERNVAARFANKPLANMPRGDKFSFAPGKRRIVHQDAHANRGRIDIHELKRRPLFAVGQCFADVNFFETGQPDDVAGGGVFYFHLLQSLVGKKRCHCSPFAAAIAMNADDRVADRHATADDSAERDSAEVIAVIEIRDEHLKKWLA